MHPLEQRTVSEGTQYTLTENRQLSRDLSREIAQLTLNPDILNIDMHTVCTETPYNFVGALIARQIAEQDLVFSDSDSKQKALDKIIRVSTGIPIYNQVGMYEYRQVGVTRTVLTKLNCGAAINLCTDGPYAGLLLKRMSNRAPEDGMQAERIMNDEYLFYGNEIHYPNHATLRNKTLNQQQLDQLNRGSRYGYLELAVQTAGYDTSCMFYEEIYAHAMSSIDKNTLLMDMIQLQCQKMNIPFDKSVMHYANPSPRHTS